MFLGCTLETRKTRKKKDTTHRFSSTKDNTRVCAVKFCCQIPFPLTNMGYDFEHSHGKNLCYLFLKQ